MTTVNWEVLGPELVKALEWFIENDETNEGDAPLQEYGGESWNQINAPWIAGLNNARALVRKAKESGQCIEPKIESDAGELLQLLLSKGFYRDSGNELVWSYVEATTLRYIFGAEIAEKFMKYRIDGEQ